MALSLGLLISLAGCATPIGERSEYPTSMPKPRASSGECPDFAGYFQNAGVQVQANGTRSEAVFTRDVLRLGETFAQDDELRMSIDTKVEWTGPFGLLGKASLRRLKIESRSGRIWQESSWEQETCVNGMLIFPTERQGFGGAPGAVILSGGGAQVFIGQDGSLIAMRHRASGGVIGVVPVYSRELIGYYHFRRADEAR
jgi:hypothetical protein